MQRFLKSRYRIGEKIGENPFSFTYKGYLMGTEVPVIIKIYKRAALNSPLINKLRPKVTKIISIDHPNIARVIDGDYGWQGFYYVREFVDGESLEDLLAKGNPDVSTSIDIIKRMLIAMTVAEEKDLVHGSINPRNIFISTAEKEVKVADFILEAAVRINPALLAEATAVYPDYMSPEQIKGEQLDYVSDIYSAGILFYQLLTGRHPFRGETGLITAMNSIKNEVVPPSEIVREVPEHIDSLVMKMLEKDAIMRLPSAHDALESIEKGRLVFNPPTSEHSGVIYDDETDPIAYEINDQKLKQKPKQKHDAGYKKSKRSARLLIAMLVILIAIASGLWYAFFLNVTGAR